MSSSPAWTNQFSLPREAYRDDALDALLGTHGQAIAERLVAEHRREIAAGSDGVIELIANWCAGAVCFDTPWDPAFSDAQLALLCNSPTPHEAAVRLALRLTETGFRGRWRATAPATTFRIGAIVLPAIEAIEVDWEGGRGCVRAAGSEQHEILCNFEQAHGEWRSTGSPPLESIGVNRPIYLLGAFALPGEAAERQGFDAVQPVLGVDREMHEAFAAAMRLIAEQSSGYLGWVERLLRGIVVCEPDAGFHAVSGSGEAAPGLIHASFPLGRFDIAEILVHECAHQYFYALERAGPVDDGSDHNRYWSPPIRSERPLSRILMAYHALANVELFYRALRESGVEDDGYLELNQPALREAIACLDEPLRDNRSLTPLGLGLYEPLAQQLGSLVA